MAELIVGLRRNLLHLTLKERRFLLFLGLGFLLTALTFQTPQIAMWVGFAFAAYSAVGNDSIQTIGPFLASNQHRPWWILWLFVGGIFFLTMLAGWLYYEGDVSFGRLSTKGFEVAPTQFSFFSVAAPLFLMVMTRLRMPVSTTFLLLSSFATSGSGVWAMAYKSLLGYGIAFGSAFAMWGLLGPWMKQRFVGRVRKRWHLALWLSTAALWCAWLMQDAANVAVYLPRSLGFSAFLAFIGFFLVGLGLLFYMGGERVQDVVNEKSDVQDVRASTVINVIYAAILFVFMFLSSVPMSTTWVFVGLLAGRELSLTMRGAGQDGRGLRKAAQLALRDLLYVTVGFLLALLLAAITNPVMGDALLGSH